MSASASPPTDPCARGLGAECAPASCHWRCALDVIDELLGHGSGISGGEMDRLLDLRWQLRQRADAEAAVRTFCELRVQMEQRHYLAFFRIRRWLENHLLAAVRVCPAAEPHVIPVKLDRYCFIAVRRACLCAALGRGSVLLAPRLAFTFRPLAAPPSAARSALALSATL